MFCGLQSTNCRKKVLPQCLCGAHVFEEFFGLEDEPVESVRIKIETRSGILRLPHEFALCTKSTWTVFFPKPFCTAAETLLQTF